MKNNRLFTTICLMAAALFTACTQDELAEQGTALPDGEYPLQIGSVSITAEASEEPWTRVSEKPDGSGSVWQPDDAITVSLDGETATYTYDGSAWTSDAPLYWKNTQTAEVTAWYPATDGALYLGGQDNGLVYVLRATADNASYDTPVSLQFKHQLAKVRVVTKGTADVGKIEIAGMPTECNIQQGEIIGALGSSRLPMRRTTYQDDTECWEANVVPGKEIQVFSVSGTNLAISRNCEISPYITPEAGKVHTVMLTVNSAGTQTIDLSNGDYTINGDGTYYFSGTASHAIRVTGGNPNIYLEDAEISVASGNGIDITGGSPTIHVKGNDNEVSSGDGAGIHVAEGSTVTITGRDRNDVLTVTGNNGSSGIGGYVIDDSNCQSANSGNINIENVTLYAYSSSQSYLGTASPGIGSTGGATCQSITIDNATVYAYGYGGKNISTPAIGNGMDWVGDTASSTPAVTISNNSEVHAHRGGWDGRSYADYIGRTSSFAFPYDDVIATVDATSVVYKYTGDGNTPDE